MLENETQSEITKTIDLKDKKSMMIIVIMIMLVMMMMII
jgi:hypothetical protein